MAMKAALLKRTARNYTEKNGSDDHCAEFYAVDHYLITIVKELHKSQHVLSAG